MKCARKCLPDVIPYATQVNQTLLGKCQCDAGFYWRITNNFCEINCTKERDIYATGIDSTTTNACACLAGYNWDATSAKCVKTILAAGFRGAS